MKLIEHMPFRPFFEDRLDAGEALVEAIGARYAGQDVIVLGIPRGGIIVGEPVARALGAVLDVVSPRKIPIPESPEMGFGAVTADGTIYLNEPLVAELGLRREEIDELADKVKLEVQRREKVYRGDRPFPDIKGKTVIVVDDGLATGYTMLAALKSLRGKSPGRLAALAPVTPLGTLELVKKEADEVIALIAQRTGGFAVASFYKRFEDLSDEAVIETLARFHGSV